MLFINSNMASSLFSLQLIKKQFAGFPVIDSRYASTCRHKQFVIRCRKIALWCDPGQRVCSVMRLRHIHAVTRVVTPQETSVIIIQRIDKNPFVRPSAGDNINSVIIHKNTASHRPARNHPSIADNSSVFKTAPEFPEKISALCIKTIKMAVIRCNVSPVFIDSRSKANRPAGCITPYRFSRFSIERPYCVIGGRSEIEQSVCNNRLETIIKIQTMRFKQRIRPGRLRRL